MQQIDDLFARYMTTRMKDFRAKLEWQTRRPLSSVRTDAASLLSKLCQFCDLDEQQRAIVMGEADAEDANVVCRLPFKRVPPPPSLRDSEMM